MQSTKANSANQELPLYVGRLMSPQEVWGATIDRPDVPRRIKNHWYLCGDAPEDFWDMMKSRPEQVGLRASGFTTPAHRAYAIFSIQVRNYQTRFLLPLGDEKVSAFLEGAQTGVWLSLGRNGGKDALLHQFTMKAAELSPLAVLSRRCRPLHWQTALSELKLMTSKMLEPGAIASALPSFTVDHVAVTLVLSDVYSPSS